MLRLIIALLFPVVAFAQDIGPSYLGMCSKSWPCGRSLRVFQGKEVAVTGWLIATFGDDCPCANKFLSLPQPKFARIHIANCTCFPERGRRCGKNEPFHGESIASADRKLRAKNGTVLRRYRRNLKLVEGQLGGVDLSQTQVYLSPCLESMFSPEARRVMLDETARVFPNYPLVDNPVGMNCIRGYVCEKHGVNPSLQAPCIADTDGDDFRVQFPIRKSQCVAQMLWQPEMNLIDPRFNGFQSPLQRTNAPTVRDFRIVREAISK